MQMIPVGSSNLVAVGYDSNSATLRVQFKSGVYDYYHVPAPVYQGLLNAGSKGSYHHDNIKNVYGYSRIG